MNPPPEATYDDVDALKVACRQHAAAHLYTVTTKRSDYKMGVLLLHCGKSGTRDDHHGLTEHNHPSLTREAAHPSHHKMTNEVKEHVRTLSTAGVAPAQILTLIRSEPLGEHRQHRIEQLDGRTPMEALLSFKMPLLHIVSFACTGATFTSAIVFLSAETIKDYEGDASGHGGELQEKLVQIQTEWMGTQPRAMQYVLSWMQYKTYFVGAYVDKVPHFESSSSSRVEGAHSALKQRLIKRLILPSHSRRSGAILFTQTCSMTSLMLWTRLGVREVVRQVSSVALIKIHLQFTITKEHAGRKVHPQPDPRFEIVMGLPLVTTIYDLHATNQSLPMSAVHK
ncbi:hypothetical protein BDL97_15G043000 [Sphagnum fallax]|nr:hypothetical protein BDL97_15G043000 [Sphagnum fallax]